MSIIPGYPSPDGPIDDSALFLGFTSGKTRSVLAGSLLAYIAAGLTRSDIESILGSGLARVDDTNSFVGPQIFQFIKVYKAGVDIDLPEGVDAGHSFTRTTFIHDIARTQQIVDSTGRFARKSYDASGAFQRVSYQVDPATGLMQSEHRAPQTANEPVTLGSQQSAAGAQNTGYQHPSTGGGLRSVYARALEEMRVTDFYDGVPQNLHPYSRLAGGDFINSFDDTPYFQRAVNACANLNIGRFRAPTSFYRVGCDGQQLFVNTAVHMEGDGCTAGGSFGGRVIGFSEQARGTWIKAGMVGNSAIVVQTGWARGSKFSGIGFTQDHPTPAPGWAPTNYAPLFGLLWQASPPLGQADISFDDLVFLGINKGIDARSCGRIWIGRITGQIFQNLVTFDDVQDRCEIESVHDWGYWNGSNPVAAYQQANKDLIVAGRCDGLTLGRIFSLFGRYGLRFIQGATGGKATSVLCQYGFFDSTQCSVFVEADGVNAIFTALRGQGENPVNVGHGVPSSNGLVISGGGGIIEIGTLNVDRVTDYCVDNRSNSTLDITRMFVGDCPDAPTIWNSPSVPINMVWPVQRIGAGALDGNPAHVNYLKSRLNP